MSTVMWAAISSRALPSSLERGSPTAGSARRNLDDHGTAQHCADVDIHALHDGPCRGSGSPRREGHTSGCSLRRGAGQTQNTCRSTPTHAVARSEKSPPFCDTDRMLVAEEGLHDGPGRASLSGSRMLPWTHRTTNAPFL